MVFIISCCAMFTNTLQSLLVYVEYHRCVWLWCMHILINLGTSWGSPRSWAVPGAPRINNTAPVPGCYFNTTHPPQTIHPPFTSPDLWCLLAGISEDSLKGRSMPELEDICNCGLSKTCLLLAHLHWKLILELAYLSPRLAYSWTERNLFTFIGVIMQT